MNIYLCLDENSVIRQIQEVEYNVIDPYRIPYHEVDMNMIGMKWNGVSAEPYVEPAQSIFTRLEFRQKFTLAEMSGIYTSESSDPVIKIILDDLRVSEYVDTNDPATQNGIGYLYQAGYLTYERMLEILG